MDKCLEELPRILLSDLLDRKLRAQGIKLSKRKLGEFTDKILNERLDRFDFNDGRIRFRRRHIAIEFTDADSQSVEGKFEKFTERLPELIEELTEKMCQSILGMLKRRWPSEARAQRRELNGFLKRLDKRWGDGIEKLRILITIAREYGSELNNAVGGAGGGASPKTFEILIKLHARSCQVAEEIVCLLRNGFADGAMAR